MPLWQRVSRSGQSFVVVQISFADGPPVSGTQRNPQRQSASELQGLRAGVGPGMQIPVELPPPVAEKPVPVPVIDPALVPFPGEPVPPPFVSPATAPFEPAVPLTPLLPPLPPDEKPAVAECPPLPMPEPAPEPPISRPVGQTEGHEADRSDHSRRREPRRRAATSESKTQPELKPTDSAFPPFRGGYQVYEALGQQTTPT